MMYLGRDKVGIAEIITKNVLDVPKIEAHKIPGIVNGRASNKIDEILDQTAQKEKTTPPGKYFVENYYNIYLKLKPPAGAGYKNVIVVGYREDGIEYGRGGVGMVEVFQDEDGYAYFQLDKMYIGMMLAADSFRITYPTYGDDSTEIVFVKLSDFEKATCKAVIGG